MNQGLFPFPGAKIPNRPPQQLQQPPDRFSNLSILLQKCNYKSANINTIGQSAWKVMKQNADLLCDTLSYNDKGALKTFLEIKGSIPVNYKGSSYSIRINIMLPQNFPQEKPYLRIINPDPNTFDVNPVYKDFQSKHDPTSYLLRDLNTLKCWGVYSSITGIIEEVQMIMGQDFPFKKKAHKPNQNQIANGFNSNQYFPKSNPGIPNSVTAQTSPKYQSHGSGYGDPTHNAPRQLNPEQQRAKGQIDQYNKKNTIIINQSSRMVDQLGYERVKDFINTQNLQVLDNVILSQNNRLQREAEQMLNFVNSNDVESDFSLKNVVVPADQKSLMLLEWMSAYKASTESIYVIQGMFQKKQISLQHFLKLIRRVEQERFTAKYFINRNVNKF